jgi:hypothetical protein
MLITIGVRQSRDRGTALQSADMSAHSKAVATFFKLTTS